MKWYKQLWLLLFLSNSCSTSPAQDVLSQQKKRCSLRTLNYETGLLHNTTTFVLTDAQGFTWISTKLGLQRFNGNRLETVIPVINNDTTAINHPVYLFNLHNGCMWISYNNQVIEYNPFRNTFRTIITIETPGRDRFMIVPLKETAEGVWCLQWGKGICIYSIAGQIIKTFSFYQKESIDTLFTSDDLLFKNIIAVNDDNIFIASIRGDILKMNTTTKRWRFLNAASTYRPALACFHHTLFAVANGKLLLINADDPSITKTVFIKQLNARSLDNYALNVDDKGHVFVSASNHLYEFDSAGNYKTEITDLNRNPVLTNGFIDKIYSDKFRRIWLTTNDNIIRIQNVETPFTHFMYPGTKNNFIRSLYYDEQKNVLLAGCINGGIQLYDTLANALWKEPVVTQDVKDVLSIEKLTNDQYLIITYLNGWYIFTLSTKQIRPVNFPSPVKAVLESRVVQFTNNIQRLNDSTLLIATGENVFQCVFDKADIRSAKPLLPFINHVQNLVDCFLYAKDKTLWTGTSGGMLYKMGQGRRPIQIFHIPGNYIVRTIAEDALHNIWVGTDKGLCVYSAAGGFLKEITTETGLLNDCVYALLPVHHSPAVFASSNYGISYISLQGNIKNYSKELNLQDLEFNTASCVQTQTGKLYFGGADGITSFYPAALSVANDTPGIFITRLVINDIPYNFSSELRQGDSLVLDYSQNHIQIDITALGLLNPNEYIYKYRLKGFQNQWEVTHQPDNINYILPPGKYVLQIICSPNLSANILFKKNITLFISPPWWRSWWFIIPAILCSIIIIAVFVHLYNRNKYRQKLRLLQAKNEMQLERERISRDLHDNLGAQANVLMHGTEQLQNTPVPDKELINNLHVTAREMMHSLRDAIWVMKSHDIPASDIWFRIINFYKQLIVFYKEIKITTEGEFPGKRTYSSEKSLHIVLIIQEALNNAVKHSQAHHIQLTSRVENSTWLISVKDNGTGITNNADKNTEGGNGLGNMRERAALAGIGLSIEGKDAQGTEVSLEIN